MERGLHPPPLAPVGRAGPAAAGLDEQGAIVVASPLAARQWEAHLAAGHVAASETAWITPPLIGFAGWSEALWQSGPEPRARPLTASQSLALWQRVIGESKQAAELLGE